MLNRLAFLLFLITTSGFAYSQDALNNGKSSSASNHQPGSDESEQSVKPGINDRFLDPSLDVSEWLGRFEIESREVYAARERVLAEIDLKPGQKVADIGAGTGFYSRLFAAEVGESGWAMLSISRHDFLNTSTSSHEPTNWIM